MTVTLGLGPKRECSADDPGQIVKYGGKEERQGIAMELQPQWRAMMESKYSKVGVSLCFDAHNLLCPTQLNLGGIEGCSLTLA